MRAANATILLLLGASLAHAEAREQPRGAARLTSIADKTWIWPTPARGERFLGYIRVGQSVALRSNERIAGDGCSGGFAAIEPRGFVCHDRTVTLEASSPWIRANADTLPTRGPLPYRYAISNGAPMYARVPTIAEQDKSEWRYGKAGETAPLPMFQRGHEHLATSDPIVAVDPIPEFLQGGGSARSTTNLLRRSLPHGSMMAFTRAFDVGGRTFLLSTDLTVVPANRVRAFSESSFHGVRLGKGTALPIGWIRHEDRFAFRLTGQGMMATDERLPVRSFVALDGQQEDQAGQRFLALAEGSNATSGTRYIRQSDATVVRRRTRRPFGVGAGDKWIIVSITEGTLVAYDDLEPVYATLISPGLGGLPRPGGDLVKDSTTPLGAFRITFKDRAATMSPEIGEDRSFWIADVPFTQYFSPPFALHATYWHERFGELMSGGCINASPMDARWLFEWTEPHVPDGWQGATGAGAKDNGRASWIVVTR